MFFNKKIYNLHFLDELGINYNIRSSNKAKSVKIKIEGNYLEITLPKAYNWYVVESFIKSKLSWIQTSLNKKKNIINIKDQIKNNNILVYWKKTEITYKKTLLSSSYCTLWDNLTTYKSHKDKRSDKSLIIDFLKKEIKKYASRQIDYFWKKLNLHPKTIKIKDQKSRWWSCSSKWNINLNYKLIFYPPSIIDYVIIHELAHLEEMNHSKRFWDIVESQAPNFRMERKFLKDNWVVII